MVKMIKIGQSACQLPKSKELMVGRQRLNGYGLVNYQLKIQSMLSKRFESTTVLTATKRLLYMLGYICT
jgi:hypothetical protein